ncbi:hypothetical protein [Salibacter halophilus]|uniref:Lysoplasmalogenase n=1 Tax=Salibacter halophilus TaxID=1803916 RepID=A0A6N6M5D5_9FLAO|nr:hypothetical protein [Salibacter halophilus]KAB1064827.1 hypothetical protein F3059_05585 [Salibacter halophilus]
MIFTFQVFFLLSALFGVYSFKKTNEKLPKLILLTQIIAVPLATVTPEHGQLGFILFMLSLLLIVIYELRTLIKENFKKNIPIIISSIFIFGKFVAQIQHYPHARIIGLSMIIPVGIYLYLLINYRKNLKNEIGFMTIITMDAAIEFASTVSVYF